MTRLRLLEGYDACRHADIAYRIYRISQTSLPSLSRRRISQTLLIVAIFVFTTSSLRELFTTLHVRYVAIYISMLLFLFPLRVSRFLA